MFQTGRMVNLTKYLHFKKCKEVLAYANENIDDCFLQNKEKKGRKKAQITFANVCIWCL
jgi:hypothetical protein